MAAVSTLSGTAPAAILLLAASAIAAANELAPFTATYDLQLTERSLDLEGGDATIVAKLTRPDCAQALTDYRFTARFVRADRTVTTEQHTVASEDFSVGTFAFRTDTTVDGLAETTIKGTAAHSKGGTEVEIEEPAEQSFRLPLQVFPSAHTADLIDRARRGERLVETRLYDGDNEAGKRLTTTAIIGAVPADDEAQDAGQKGPAGILAGLDRWRISESYYNSDGEADGLPLFRTSYTLYENGVSDALVIDTGDYAFSGALSDLTLGTAPDCGRQP